MQERHYTPLDRLLSGLGHALRTVAGPAAVAAREYPAANIEDVDLDDAQKKHAAGLMRVNHAGEVAAQALYQGHAVAARDAGIKSQMREAAREEEDHLAWCERRLRELGAAPSKLSPVWYAGAFTIAAASGVLGDKWSLGFIAETEQQVCAHLDRHLSRLPEDDRRSRAIVARMRDEEEAHGADARAAGAAELPVPVKRLMQMTSRIMTTLAYRL